MHYNSIITIRTNGFAQLCVLLVYCNIIVILIKLVSFVGSSCNNGEESIKCEVFCDYLRAVGFSKSTVLHGLT
jgi:hypothetical protein